MIVYNYTQEQHDEIVMNLLKIQINLPTKDAPKECEVIGGAIKEIYKVLYSERKVHNPVTGKDYTIRYPTQRRRVKGMWSKE